MCMCSLILIHPETSPYHPYLEGVPLSATINIINIIDIFIIIYIIKIIINIFIIVCIINIIHI